MVTVPSYGGRSVALRPDMQQGVDVRASANAFGAGVADGLQGLSRGLGQASDAMARLRDFEDGLRARDALTSFEREKMQLDYGENGFLTTQGRDAVDRRPQYEADLEALRKKYASGLTGGAAQLYNDASTEAVTGAMRTGIAHSAQGRKDWAATSSTARLATFSDQALTAYKDPAAVGKSIAAGYMEIDAQADLMGWDQSVVDVKRQEFATQVHSSVALAMAGENGGATRALEYLTKNSGDMSAATRMELEAKLKPYANDEAALKVVDEIMLKPRGGGAAAGDGTVGAGGPTNARAKLYGRAAAAGKGKDHVDGLGEDFASNLNAMFEDAPPGIREGLQIGSGFRSVERQEELFAEAVKKYGSVEAARKWVAPPGNSQHNHGNAVDIWYNGQRLDKAPAEVRDWVHANAEAYGLRFPMEWESWHIEPAGARGGGAGSTVVPSRDGVSARSSMPSYDEAIAAVNEITDPAVRAAAMKQLNAQFEMRSKAESAAATAAKSDMWSMVAQGVSVADIPLDLKIAAGREAVQGFMDYETKAGEITTDPALLRNLTLYAATNPVEFAKTDLLAPEVINGLSKADLKALTEKQASVLTDERKAREDGLNVSQAMGYAKTQLEAVGVTQTGAEDATARQAAAKREAEFQMALVNEMQAWSEANGGKKPTQLDIMQMTNRLLLPIVIKTPGTFYDSEETGKFAFEAGGRADGTTVDVVVEYGDIPLDLRRGIALDLERELGRKPSEEEVVQRYEDFTLSR